MRRGERYALGGAGAAPKRDGEALRRPTGARGVVEVSDAEQRRQRRGAAGLKRGVSIAEEEAVGEEVAMQDAVWRVAGEGQVGGCGTEASPDSGRGLGLGRAGRGDVGSRQRASSRCAVLPGRRWERPLMRRRPALWLGHGGAAGWGEGVRGGVCETGRGGVVRSGGRCKREWTGGGGRMGCARLQADMCTVPRGQQPHVSADKAGCPESVDSRWRHRRSHTRRTRAAGAGREGGGRRMQKGLPRRRRWWRRWSCRTRSGALG